MASLARYSGIRQLPGVRRPQVIADTAIGEATAALGRQIRQSASQIGELARVRSQAEDRRRAEIRAAHQYQIDNFEGRKRLLELFASVPAMEAEARKNMKPGGAGYAVGVASNYDKGAEIAIANTPQSAQAKIKRQLEAQRPQIIARAEKTENVHKGQYYRDGIAEVCASAGASITADPATYDAAFGVCSNTISESGLAPQEKEMLLGSAKRDMQLRYAQSLPARERANFSVPVDGTNSNSDGPSEQDLAPDILKRTGALTPKDIAEIREKGQRDQIKTASNKQESFSRRISENPLDIDPDEFRNDPDLNEGQIGVLERIYGHAMDEQARKTESFFWFRQGGKANPYNDHAREMADIIWKAALPHAENPDALAKSIIADKGLIPKSYVNDLKAGFSGEKWEVTANAYQRVSELYDLDRLAVEGNEDAKVLIEAVRTWRAYTTEMGLTAEEAAKRLMELRDPEAGPRLRAFQQSPAVQAEINGLTRDRLELLFGAYHRLTSIKGTPAEVKLGNTAEAGFDALKDYFPVFLQAVLETKGDIPAAHKLAMGRYSTVYRTTKFPPPVGEKGGVYNTAIKYPAEWAYVDLGDDYAYLDAAAKNAR